MSETLEVEVRDGVVYHQGTPVEKEGEFYLVGKEAFENLKKFITERLTKQRNNTVEETHHEMSDELKAALPERLKVDDGFEYNLDSSSVAVLKGKILWIRYKTLEQELGEIPKGGKDE